MTTNIKRRVAVTGLGAVTPLGPTFETTWAGVLRGESKAAKVSIFEASEFPTNFAYEVLGFHSDETKLLPAEKPLLNRAGKFMVGAGLEAMEQAGWGEIEGNRQKRAVCLGVGIGCPDFSWHAEIYLQEQYSDESVRLHQKNYPATVATILARLAEAHGGVTTVHTACASSGQALGEAYEMIAYGERDLVLTGGADSMINPFHMAGFCLLGALSKKGENPATASKPFDVARDGFVLGEGACALVFEEWDHAIARGARILGEVVGYGVTESAYRITDLHPEGMGPFEAMQIALKDAQVSASQLGYINAHGTSTQLNDRVEALAISRLLATDPVSDGHRRAGGLRCRVSSTKSTTGHLISAAGAIEFAFCIKALEQQILPPSVNLSEKDPTCAVELTGAVQMAATFDYALSNSVGFGGSNTALVARRVNQ